MRRKLASVGFALLLAASLAVGLFGTAAAHSPCASDGRGYGVDHIAGHTPHGPADENHNPGTHMGFSLCLGVHD